MSTELITIAVGAIISFALQAVPGLNTKWETLPGNAKRWLVLALCALVPIVGVWSACNGYDLHMGAVCPPDGLSGQVVFELFLSAGLAFVGMVGGYVAGNGALKPD